MTASIGLARRSSSEVIWRLRGSVPSFQTRAISAPNTVITAPPARNPSRRVRLLGLLRAASAAARRLALRGDTGARPPSQVGLGELLHEDHAELHERAELGAEARPARAERRELLGEVACADDDGAAGHLLRGLVAALFDVAAQHAGEERRRVPPDVEPRVVLDQLEAGHRQRVADAVVEPEPVEHVLDAGLDVDEEVEPALDERQRAGA